MAEEKAGYYSEAAMSPFDLQWDMQSHQSQLVRHRSLPLSSLDEAGCVSQLATHGYQSPTVMPSTSSRPAGSPSPSAGYGISQRVVAGGSFAVTSPPESPKTVGRRSSSSSHSSSNVYRLNLSPRESAEGMVSPRVSDVGGLSRFLPSNNEPNEDDLSVWAGALKSAGLAGGGGGGIPISDVSVYSSDEFRIYEFKVRRCMRGRSHDWTDCPFAHPGEKARRRDPRKYHYSGTACPDFRKGACRRGDACEFAHGVFECWLHPARYRTQPCKDGRNCKRRVCFFAHTPEQLRLLPAAAVAASQALPHEAGAAGGSGGAAGDLKQGGGGGPTPQHQGPPRLSPTSTLACPSSSPGVSPPLTPVVSPPSSPSHPDHFFASPRSVSLGLAGVSPAASPAAHLGQFGNQGPASPSPSPRFFPASPSPRAAPTWGSPLSPAGSQGGGGVPPPAPLARSLSGMAGSMGGGSQLGGGALRQRQLERFHSLPALAIPTGIDPGPLSVSSPYAASPSHHRLALLQAAAAAANGQSPAAPSLSSASLSAVASPNQYSTAAEQQAANSRAALMSELVASLQALEMQSAAEAWSQAQQEAQVRAQMQRQAQAQAQVQWQAQAQAQASAQARAEAQARAHAQAQAQAQGLAQGSMQYQQQLLGGQNSGRMWGYDSRMGRTPSQPGGSSRMEVLDHAEASEGFERVESGRELRASFYGKDAAGREAQDGADVAWVSNLVKDEGGAGQAREGEEANQNGTAVGSDPWADAGRWASAAHA